MHKLGEDRLAEIVKTAFKSQNFPLAIQHYSKSADMALSRPPWELAALSRDETSIALCNRSAAFAFAGAWSVGFRLFLMEAGKETD